MEYNVYIYFQFCRVIETTVIEEEKRKTLYGRNAKICGGKSYKPKLRYKMKNETDRTPWKAYATNRTGSQNARQARRYSSNMSTNLRIFLRCMGKLMLSGL